MSRMELKTFFEDRQFPAIENADLFHANDMPFLLNSTESIRGMNIDPIRMEKVPGAIGRFPLMILTACDDIFSQQTKIQTRFDDGLNSMRQFVRTKKKECQRNLEDIVDIYEFGCSLRNKMATNL